MVTKSLEPPSKEHHVNGCFCKFGGALFVGVLATRVLVFGVFIRPLILDNSQMTIQGYVVNNMVLG